MDQQAPHNLPFEPEDLPPLAPPIPPPAPPVAPPVIPKVDLPPPAPPVPPSPSRFLSSEPMTPARTATGPKQPEDMFAGLEGAANVKAPPRVLSSDPLVTTHASYGKYILLICCLVGGLGIVAAGLWYFAIHRPAQQAQNEAIVTQTIPAVVPPVTEPVAPVVTPPSTNTIAPEDLIPTPVPTIPPPTSAPVVTTPPAGANIPPPTAVDPVTSPVVATSTSTIVDTDKDGLSDTREQELGTDARNPDTDGDGLTDGDEVLKYGTNPLKMDTDGDTYSDGLEVKGGFNPRGPGKCSTSDCTIQ